ncbi:hypothetical protein M0802_010866 [Mischocyttarus mexicanus]|nr:hypothetical protein M0802_010866 [Mischocyttarus mexicanus]
MLVLRSNGVNSERRGRKRSNGGGGDGDGGGGCRGGGRVGGGIEGGGGGGGGRREGKEEKEEVEAEYFSASFCTLPQTRVGKSSTVLGKRKNRGVEEDEGKREEGGRRAFNPIPARRPSSVGRKGFVQPLPQAEALSHPPLTHPSPLWTNVLPAPVVGLTKARIFCGKSLVTKQKRSLVGPFWTHLSMAAVGIVSRIPYRSVRVAKHSECVNISSRVHGGLGDKDLPIPDSNFRDKCLLSLFYIKQTKMLDTPPIP